MKEKRIAKSTGKIDRRTLNGNNGTRRGTDKKERAAKWGYYTLRDEVKASLKTRLLEAVEFYGGKQAFADAIGVGLSDVTTWIWRGRISVPGAEAVMRDFRRNGFKGFRSSYLRPDIKFDLNGRALERKCSNIQLMRYVSKTEAEIMGKKRVMTPEQIERHRLLTRLRKNDPEAAKMEVLRYKEERRKKRIAEKQKKLESTSNSTNC